jgi:hypothetical protein
MTIYFKTHNKLATLQRKEKPKQNPPPETLWGFAFLNDTLWQPETPYLCHTLLHQCMSTEAEVTWEGILTPWV